jgi:dolichol-phosphate mannosyltransferase
MNKPPVISVVIPVHNEAENIKWFYDELSDLFKGIKQTYELIYINDGSTDNTSEMLKTIAKDDASVQNVCLARNFGKEAATSAGIHLARGDVAIILDGDGQHPPEKIKEMLKLWNKGYQHVVGIRATNEKAGLIKTLGSKVFYFLAKRLGATGITANSTDFRLLDRELIDTFKLYGEKKRMTRALLDWSGYKTTHITFDARQRIKGVASYKFRSLLRLAISGYIGATLKPLYLVGVLGVIITVLSFLLVSFLGISQLFFNDPLNLGVSGTAYIALFVTFLVGLLMISQGITAAYIANIQLEAQNRPLYIINRAESTIR